MSDSILILGKVCLQVVFNPSALRERVNGQKKGNMRWLPVLRRKIPDSRDPGSRVGVGEVVISYRAIREALMGYPLDKDLRIRESQCSGGAHSRCEGCKRGVGGMESSVE